MFYDIWQNDETLGLDYIPYLGWILNFRRSFDFNCLGEMVKRVESARHLQLEHPT